MFMAFMNTGIHLEIQKMEHPWEHHEQHDLQI